MRRDLFKITKEEKNRIKNLHETVKHNPTIDSTLVLNEHQGTPGTAHRHSNPNACSNMTCCDNNGDGYCPAGTPKSCPDTGYAWNGRSCVSDKSNMTCCDSSGNGYSPSGTLKSCPDTGYAWNGRSCVSDKKTSQGCCDCRQTNPQPYSPMGGGGCPEIVGVVTAMGGSCREACRDFAPNLQSIKKPTQQSPTDPNEKESGLNERTYELPIRYGKKRMSESQLVKMLRRISEEQELEEKAECKTHNDCATGSVCMSTGKCCEGGDHDCMKGGNMVAGGPGKTKGVKGVNSTSGSDSAGGKSRGGKLKERTLTNIVRKVMFEMEELNEVQVFKCYGEDNGGNCVQTGSYQGTTRHADCKAGCGGEIEPTDGGGKVRGGVNVKPSSRGEKSKRYGPSDDIHVQFPDYGIPGMFEERLSGIVRNVMSEMKMR